MDVYLLFNEELNAVKKELTLKAVPLIPSHPKYSGAAHWARMLKRRIEKGMMVGVLLSQHPLGLLFRLNLNGDCS